MSMSMTHKILARAAGRATVASGDFLEAKIDMAFTHDPVLEGLAQLFYEHFGKDAKVFDPKKIALFQDHLVPAKDSASRRLALAMDHFAAEQGIDNYYPYGKNYGVCHIVMCEQGHVLPGTVVIGTDSHSVTYGAFNAFGSGVGMWDMVSAFRTGELWFKVPETIRIEINGELPEGVLAKDIVLRLCGDLTMAGASGKTIEYTGSTIENMSAEERMTLCNMVVEMGATNGIMAMSPAAEAYLAKVSDAAWEPVTTDPDFEYHRKLSYDASELTPMVAYPHRPDNTRTIQVAKDEKIAIQQVYVGSCTGAKINDIRTFVEGLRGQSVAASTRAVVVPASTQIYKEMTNTGLTAKLLEAGAMVESPGCKACYGALGGVLGDGERCLSTTNRNFRGRMGNPLSEVFLASPFVAARTAVTGHITDE